MKFATLEQKIAESYIDGVTMEQAERLAGEFLSAQLQVSEELKRSDLDSRMRKASLKAVRANVYLTEVSKGEKKPTEAMLSSLIDTNESVMTEQGALDEAEAERDNLKRYFDVFSQAHVHFRSIAKGSFNS